MIHAKNNLFFQKKNNRPLILGIFTVLLATTMVAAAMAGKGRGRGHKGSAHSAMGPHGMIQQLDLTAAQQKQIDKLKEKERTVIEKARTQIDKLRSQMRIEWEKETLDRKNIQSIQKRMHEQKGKIGQAKMDFRLSVFDTLTPKQRKKAAAMHKEHHQRRQEFKKANPDCSWGNRRGKKGDGRGQGNGRGQGHGRGPGFGFDNGPMW